MTTFETNAGACDLRILAKPLPRSSLAGTCLDIVVADDNNNNRIYMNALLKGFGHRVRMAEDGEKAVAMVTQNLPDLVIMDMHMPVMDGFTAIQTLRQSGGAAAEVPILVLTADIRPELMVETHALGIQGYLFKPLEVPLLLPILEGLFPQGGRYAIPPQGAPRSGSAELAPPQQTAVPVVRPAPLLMQNETQGYLNVRIVEDVVRIVKPQGYSEMLQEFSLPDVGNLTQLVVRLSAGETTSLAALAHATKGEAAALGLQEISKLAKQVEFFGAGVEPPERALVLAQLGEVWEASIAQLDRLGFLVSPPIVQAKLPQPP